MKELANKINYLNDYLKEKYNLELIDIFNEEKEIIKDILNNNINHIDEDLINKITSFFFLDSSYLLDDSKTLPKKEDLDVDDVLLNKIQDEYKVNLGKKKRKHVIKRNYSLLTKKYKHKLFRTLSYIFIPFLIFVSYSISTILINVNDTLSTYKENSYKSYENVDETLTPIEGKYVNVNVGTTLERISDIDPSSSSFKVTMILRFDFSQEEFHNMFFYDYKNEIFNENKFYNEDDLISDNFCFNEAGDGYLPYKDNIPDIYQFNFLDNTHMSIDNEPLSVSTLYTKEVASFPGEKSSNVFPDKNDEFSIGNGRIHEDTLEYTIKSEPYIDEDNEYRMYQELHFIADINKVFDSPRYPLDSVQFHIYIKPLRSTNYIRYIPDKSMSSFSPTFQVTDGYRLIKNSDEIENFSLNIYYYNELDLDKSSITFNQYISKSELEITVRCNKHGFSVFVNNFLNIIAVAIWLILAFYNQSFNKEDSLGMIGTGFFSAISAILLGFSLVSNANLFSLLSIINIFTLAMVLVMGYESISAQNNKHISDNELVAYKIVKMRLIYYFLLICSFIMYIILPCISYIWIL